MPSSSRARACDACHTIKIKCELGSKGGTPPCARCLRLGKDCAVTPPVRQKDRVAELEAKIETLTKLLEAHNLRVDSASVGETASALSHGGASPVPPIVPVIAGETSKKRRLENSSKVKDSFMRGATGDAVDFENAGLELDFVVPREVQVRILGKYHNEIMPRLSLASLATIADYTDFRVRYPLLLQVVIYVACSGLVSVDVEEEISKTVFGQLAPDAVAKNKKSMEVVQALQLAACWYRIPKHNTHLPLFQLVELAMKVSKDIGIDGPQCSTLDEVSDFSEQVSAGDAWRTWIIFYLYSAYMGSCIRIPHPVSWNSHYEQCIFGLEYWIHGLSTDRLLCQFTRALRVCEQIEMAAKLKDSNSVVDVTDPITQLTMCGLQNIITDWEAQVPASLDCAALKMWGYLATLYLHECVLHTTTNKQSFAGPFVAERLSVTDFPMPVVTPDHVASLYALRDASQALLDIFTSLEIPELLAFPHIFFVTQALYAEWILVKLYVSMKAFGNTYGAFVDANSLRLQEFLQKLIVLGTVMSKNDSQCVQSRILSSTSRMKEWVCNFDKSHSKQTSALASPGFYLTQDSSNLEETNYTNWGNFDPLEDIVQHGLEDLFGYTI